MDVIEALRQQAAQDQEALRARGLMIEILDEAVERLRVAGFTVALELAECDALVVLRLDTSAWALRQVGLPPRVLEREPAMKIETGPSTSAAAVGSSTSAAAPDKAKPAAFQVSFWTPEMNARIVAMRKEMPIKAIAKEVGVTEKALGVQFVKLKRKGWDLPPPVQVRRTIFAKPATRRDGVVLRDWTEADDAALIEAYGAGDKDLSVVAADLGRSHSALTKRLTHLRRAGRITESRGIVPLDLKWSEERIQRLRDLWPVTRPADIAAEFGLSKGAVTGMAFRLELGPSFRGGAVAAGAQTVSAPVPDAVALPDPEPEQKSEPVSVPEAEPVPEPAPAPPPFVASRGGNIMPAMARPAHHARAPAKLLPGLSEAQKKDAIAAHVAALPVTDIWDAEIDLELCEDAFAGRGVGFVATLLGIDTDAAKARFALITDPLRRDGVKGLPIEASALILPALRARLAKARGAAA